MKQFLLSALCAAAALSLFTPESQAQAPAESGTGTSSSGGPGAGLRRRGGGGLEEKHAREIIAKYDKDGDHALNASELAAFFEAIHQRAEEHRSQQASTGSLSAASNPGNGTGQHAGGGPQEHAAKAIEKFDKNGDGKLEVGEVAAMLRAIRERLQERGGQHRAAPGATTTSTTNT